MKAVLLALLLLPPAQPKKLEWKLAPGRVARYAFLEKNGKPSKDRDLVVFGSELTPSGNRIFAYSMDIASDGTIFVAAEVQDVVHEIVVRKSEDGGLTWTDLSANGLPSEFGFPLVSHPRDPKTFWIIPLNGADRGRFPTGLAVPVIGLQLA